MPHFVYHPRYELKFGDHVFPVHKYRLIYERLIAEGLVAPEAFLVPHRATDQELLLVHKPSYLHRLDSLLENPFAAMKEFEAPINDEVADSIRYATGGSILACERALADGTAVLNISGGFHHAFPDHGEGFCFINDVAIAARYVLEHRLADAIAIIDCDLHQGNGTAAIFEDDPDVFTFSIHQQILYPRPKERSDLDIGLAHYTDDATYLGHIRRHVPDILDRHDPDLVLYVAGADPFEGDQLGNLRLTKPGLRQRDEAVLGAARERGLPVAIVTAGGYAQDTTDVVDIHVNTCRVMLELWEETRDA